MVMQSLACRSQGSGHAGPMTILAVLAMVFSGCASFGRNPTIPSPDVPNPAGASLTGAIPDPGPHRLWSDWRFFIDSSHEKVDVEPQRGARIHLNALKFLESYCTDCLEITDIKNNGDGTIDLTVQITHPFPGHPEYTGFDVKGIIMFQGSHEIPVTPGTADEYLPLYPQSFRLSWRLAGDPEILNADGYTYYWSPWYDSGSTLPVFSYWPGKYSKGTPTANINGFLYFYSNENRHMFEAGETVSRTYHIWLPPGPVTAGYAVDACWQPPDVIPVTDPASDFPITANQPEAYRFKCVYNDGQPITPDWFKVVEGVHHARAEFEIMYCYGYPWVPPKPLWVGVHSEVIDLGWFGYPVAECDKPPDQPTWWCLFGIFYYPPGAPPDGTYQLLAYGRHLWGVPHEKWQFPAFDVVEIVLDTG